MTWAWWIAALFLALASLASTLSLAMMTASHSVLAARLEAQGKHHRAVWLAAHLDEARLAIALVRTLLRLAVFVFALLAVAHPDESLTTMTVEFVTLALVAVGTGVALWVSTTVLGSAIARHAGAEVLVGMLPLVKLATVMLLPVVRSLAFLDEAVRRLSGANLRDDSGAEEELLRRIEDSQRAGQLDEASAALLENVVEFRSTDVGEVMTPRTDIDGIEVTDSLPAVRAFIIEVGHSRIPVYEGNLDHVIGVLYVKDLVPYLGADTRDFSMRDVVRQPIVVPETKPVRELLADFQRSEVHMAIVIDEYGGTAGLVTIEDVLEEIVGEIHDEHDLDVDEVPELRAIDDARAEVDGRYRIDDLNEELGLALPEDDEYDTVAGFMLAHLGRVPEVGESFEWEGARFTALAAAATHIERVGIERMPVP